VRGFTPADDVNYIQPMTVTIVRDFGENARLLETLSEPHGVYVSRGTVRGQRVANLRVGVESTRGRTVSSKDTDAQYSVRGHED